MLIQIEQIRTFIAGHCPIDSSSQLPVSSVAVQQMESSQALQSAISPVVPPSQADLLKLKTNGTQGGDGGGRIRRRRIHWDWMGWLNFRSIRSNLAQFFLEPSGGLSESDGENLKVDLAEAIQITPTVETTSLRIENGGDYEGVLGLIGQEVVPANPPATMIVGAVDLPLEMGEASPLQWKSVYMTPTGSESSNLSLLLGRKTFIGRVRKGNQIVVDDPCVKPVHAAIYVKDTVVMLIDSSGDGIEVNGQKRHGRFPLKSNDRITIGETVLRVDIA